jgi:hypothetical protein
METRLIQAIWWLSVLANGALAVKVARPWVWKRYPLFAGWVVYQALVSSLLLLAGGASLRLHPYAEIWKAVQLPSAILLAAVAVEAFWVLARQFRGMNLLARRLLGCLAAVSALLSVIIARGAHPWAGDLRPYYVFWEHVAFALAIICLLALWFFGRHLDFGRLRPNSRIHAAILSGLFLSLFLASYLMNASYGAWRFAASLIIPGGQFAAFTLWLALLKRSGEVIPFAERPILSAAEFANLEQADRSYSQALEEVGSDALRKALRPKGT